MLEDFSKMNANVDVFICVSLKKLAWIIIFKINLNWRRVCTPSAQNVKNIKLNLNKSFQL